MSRHKSASRDSPRVGVAEDLIALVSFVAVCLAVGWAGGAVTAQSVDGWYQELVKPPFNPPDWVFAPVWTVLYLMMSVAAWRVWRVPGRLARRRALAVFSLQLALNLLWSFLFFGLKAPAAALAEIALLWIAVLATAFLFGRVDRIAGWLFVPYVLWVSFAVVLNAAIWRLN